jgi:hypothetical protein
MLTDPFWVLVATSVTMTVPVRVVVAVGSALTFTISVVVPEPVAVVPLLDMLLNVSMLPGFGLLVGFGLNVALQLQPCVLVMITLTLPPAAATWLALTLTE